MVPSGSANVAGSGRDVGADYLPVCGVGEDGRAGGGAGGVGGTGGIVCGVPDTLDSCARIFNQCADESEVRDRRLSDAIGRHGARNSRPCGVGVASPGRIAAKKRAIAGRVTVVAAGLRNADSAPTFRNWFALHEPVGREVGRRVASRRTSRPWEPTWDPMDPRAPRVVNDSFDDYVVCSTVSVGAASFGEGRVASIRKVGYSDGSFEITVGTFVSDSFGGSVGAGAFVKNKGSVAGVALGASAALHAGSGEAMSWRFRSKQDADQFVDLVTKARSDYAKQHYDWSDKVRDLTGDGLVHSHAPTSFWKMALEINPFPDSFTRQSGTTAVPSADLLVLNSTVSGSAAVAVGVRTIWDLRRGRTTVETIPAISGSLTASRSDVGTNDVAGSVKVIQRTTYETSSGRVLATSKTVERIAVANTPGSEESTHNKQTRTTETTTVQFRDRDGKQLPDWTESTQKGSSREVSGSDGQGGFGGGLAVGTSRLYGPIGRALTVSLAAPVVRTVVKGPIGKPPNRPKDVSPKEIALPAEVASLRT